MQSIFYFLFFFFTSDWVSFWHSKHMIFFFIKHENIKMIVYILSLIHIFNINCLH